MFDQLYIKRNCNVSYIFLLKCLCAMSMNHTSYQYYVFFNSVHTGSELKSAYKESLRVNISGHKQKC